MSNQIPDLPILGEPLIPEFANTLYVDRLVRVDVLDHPAWISAWLQKAPCVAGLGAPRRIRTEDADRLRLLRDALRGLLTRSSGEDCTAEVSVINDAAHPAAHQRLLTLTPAGEFGVVTRTDARGVQRLVATIASHVIDAVECGQLDLNQQCGRPGCNLFYFRDHHRRRYCNSRCANADRQARYHRRLGGRSASATDI